MQNSIWKLSALAGLIAIGFLVVLQAQRGLPVPGEKTAAQQSDDADDSVSPADTKPREGGSVVRGTTDLDEPHLPWEQSKPPAGREAAFVDDARANDAARFAEVHGRSTSPVPADEDLRSSGVSRAAADDDDLVPVPDRVEVVPVPESVIGPAIAGDEVPGAATVFQAAGDTDSPLDELPSDLGGGFSEPGALVVDNARPVPAHVDHAGGSRRNGAARRAGDGIRLRRQQLPPLHDH